jgi:NADH:ubiquinone reductase (H+-translocating)
VGELGGVKAAANPLGVPLSGLAAGAVTRGYHLAAMPGNRVRVAADWLLDAVLPRQAVQLGLVRSWSVPLDTASPELARVPGRPQARQEADARSGPGAATEQETRPGRRATEPAAPAVEEAEQGVPSVGPTDEWEPTEVASAGEAVISEAKAREAAEQESPGRQVPVQELPERQASERNAPEQKAPQPAKNQPGGEPAKHQPGAEPAKNQPGPEPAKNQPDGEPGQAPGPVKRTDADPAEGDS